MMILPFLSAWLARWVSSALLLVLDHIGLVRLQPNKDTFPQFSFVYMEIYLCGKLDFTIILGITIRTTCEHALYKIGYVAEYNPESFWAALLTSNRLDLYTL